MNTGEANASPNQKPEQKLTYGQKAVGLDFNPSGESSVDRCKIGYANIIDQMDELRNKSTTTQEQKRLASVAITQAQDAQMWAVKALTWKD